MAISIIIVGAAGRMGSLLAHLCAEADDLLLEAVVERPTHLERIAAHNCAKSGDLTEILPALQGAVIIDFTSPESSLDTARLAARHGNPLVIGTTGLSEAQKAELAELALKTPILLSPNMSVGINVLLQILPELTRLLGDNYDAEIMEIHHKHKKDAPSGTAERLAEALAEGKGWNLDDTACYCRHGIIGERPDRQIGVQTLRGGDVVGVHTAYFFGPGERIEITHQAHSRENFANGALRAARWLHDKPAGRLYSMRDVLSAD